MKNKKTIFMSLMLCNSVIADEFSDGEVLSLYNIGTSALIYSVKEQNDAYVSALRSYNLNNGWERNANWVLKKHGDGSFQFRNDKSSILCLSRYGLGYQMTQHDCSYSTDQKFNIKKQGNGAYLLQLAYRNECAYIYTGYYDYYVYTDTCPDTSTPIDRKWLWALIPPKGVTFRQ